jgi:hypothetical protein
VFPSVPVPNFLKVELELELLEFTLELELELFKKHQFQNQFHFLVFCKNLSITECEKLKSDYQSDSVNVKVIPLTLLFYCF